MTVWNSVDTRNLKQIVSFVTQCIPKNSLKLKLREFSTNRNKFCDVSRTRIAAEDEILRPLHSLTLTSDLDGKASACACNDGRMWGASLQRHKVFVFWQTRSHICDLDLQIFAHVIAEHHVTAYDHLLVHVRHLLNVNNEWRHTRCVTPFRKYFWRHELATGVQLERFKPHIRWRRARNL